MSTRSRKICFWGIGSTAQKIEYGFIVLWLFHTSECFDLQRSSSGGLKNRGKISEGFNLNIISIQTRLTYKKLIELNISVLSSHMQVDNIRKMFGKTLLKILELNQGNFERLRLNKAAVFNCSVNHRSYSN
jgi:hypothetical protein